MSKAKKKHPGPRTQATAKKMSGDMPKPRTEWKDFQDRKLKITKVEKGRVFGNITFSPTGKTKDIMTRPYSCDLKIFEHIWMKQKPPADPVSMATAAHKRGLDAAS